jgi:hypothetical protein
MNFDILQFHPHQQDAVHVGLFFRPGLSGRAYGLFGLVFITFILCFTSTT